MKRIFLGIFAASLALAGSAGAGAATTTGARDAKADKGAKAATASYMRMTPDERLAYVERRAGELAPRLFGVSAKTLGVNKTGAEMIRRELDWYASRVGASAEGAGKDDLRSVIDRGAASAATINRAFNAENLSPLTGLYLAMVESEYHECLTSSMGASGMFQFLPQTATRYGVDPKDLCDVEKAAPAAARYIRDRRAEFGTDGAGSLLALLSYNVGQKAVAADFADARAGKTDAERFDLIWATMANPRAKTFSKSGDDEGSRYVPRFVAAAIVGESPADFGLESPALSSY